MNRKGILYGVGVGPGDPDLLTIRAVKTLDMADVIACPARGSNPGLAYRTAEQACPRISEKERILLRFPMERGDLAGAHLEAADRLISVMKSGKDVAFLTLGDPGFYSTFYYVAGIVGGQGYTVEVISGIPSFSAVSARLKLPAALGDGSVMITSGRYCEFDGTLLILKAGAGLREIKEKAAADGKKVYMVENCGLPDEKVYEDLSSVPDEAGYFSVLVVR